MVIEVQVCSGLRQASGVPQFLQKPRSPPDDDTHQVIAPRVSSRSSVGTPAKEPKTLPAAFWHIRQWQMHGRAGWL
jgi:hypothetical protein